MKNSNELIYDEEVRGYFYDCEYTDEELVGEIDIDNVIIVESERSKVALGKELLTTYRKKIIEMINNIRNIESGIVFEELGFDKEGNCWTEDENVMDMLLKLGLALSILEVEEKGSILYIRKSNEKDIKTKRTATKEEFETFKNNQIIPFDKLPQVEKERLLLHWFCSTSENMTIGELSEFRALLSERIDEVYKVAFTDYIMKYHKNPILVGIRYNNLDERIDNVINMLSMFETECDNNSFASFEYDFLRKLKESYNEPQDKGTSFEYAMHKVRTQTPEEFLVGLPNQVAHENVTSELVNQNYINEIFNSCLFNEDEIKDGVPTIASVIAKGINSCVAFNYERLMANQDKIKALIDCINLPQTGIYFAELALDTENNLWTDNFNAVNKILLLGLATGILHYVVSDEKDDTLPSKMPLIERVNDNKKEIDITLPKSYSKTRNKVETYYRRNICD